MPYRLAPGGAILRKGVCGVALTAQESHDAQLRERSAAPRGSSIYICRPSQRVRHLVAQTVYEELGENSIDSIHTNLLAGLDGTDILRWSGPEGALRPPLGDGASPSVRRPGPASTTSSIVRALELC